MKFTPGADTLDIAFKGYYFIEQRLSKAFYRCFIGLGLIIFLGGFLLFIVGSLSSAKEVNVKTFTNISNQAFEKPTSLNLQDTMQPSIETLK